MKVCLTSLTRFRKQEILGSGLDQLLSVVDVPEEGGGSVRGNNHHVEVPWLQKLLTGDLNLEMNYGSLRSFVNNGGCSPTARCWKRQAPIPPETLHLSAGPHCRGEAATHARPRKVDGQANFKASQTRFSQEKAPDRLPTWLS